MGAGPDGVRRPRTLAGTCCGLQPYLSLVTPAGPSYTSPWNHSATAASYVAVCEKARAASCLRSSTEGPSGRLAMILG